MKYLQEERERFTGDDALDCYDSVEECCAFEECQRDRDEDSFGLDAIEADFFLSQLNDALAILSGK